MALANSMNTKKTPNMALAFLKETPEMAFRKTERDLRIVNPRMNLTHFKNMTPIKLEEEISKLDEIKNRITLNNTYGSWLSEDKYVELTLLREALSFLCEYKTNKRKLETLIPKFTYYRKAKVNQGILTGERIFFNESRTPDWVSFSMPVAIAKANELLKHGTDEHFKTIYIEMANGELNPFDNVKLSHLYESSDSVLAEIEQYCDANWDGGWPWEINSPYKIRELIEDKKQMKRNTLSEMRNTFNELMRKLNEDDMDKFEVISAAEEMMAKIEGMIQELGRLAGEGMLTLKDQTRSAIGDHAAEAIDTDFMEPIKQAADALSQLRVTMSNNIEKLKGSNPGDQFGGDQMGDQMGDQLGGGLGDGLDDEMAGMDMTPNDGERPMKLA